MKMKAQFTLLFLFIYFGMNAQDWQATYIGGAHNETPDFSFQNDSLLINGTGVDWWNAQDDGYFVYQELCGDVTLIARLDSQEMPNQWAKAGLVIRKDLTPGAITATLVNTEAGGLLHQYRSATDVQMTNIGGDGGAKLPIWLRISKKANTVSFSYSSDGTDWTTLGEQTMNLNSSFYIGFGVTSVLNTLATSLFSEISIEQEAAASFSFIESESLNTETPYTLASAADASGETFVQVLGEQQNTAPSSGLIINIETCNNNGAHALWGRFRNTEKAWVKREDTWEVWDVGSTTEWEWKRLSIGGATQDIELSGATTIELAYEGDFEIDRLLVTDSLNFVPKGFAFTELFSGKVYLSAEGDDANSGKSPEQAWKTLDAIQDRINGALPGTQILFRKGDTFSGGIEMAQSGTAANPIEFGSYGSGTEKPILSGAVSATNWELHEGSIYKTSLEVDEVGMVFFDGELLTLARYPNEGLLFTNDNVGASGLASDEITQEDGYWNGATARFRSRDWSWEHREVENHTGTAIEFISPSFNDMQRDRGFYFDNKFEELDQTGEWFYDEAEKILYLWSPEGQNPNDHEIYVSVTENGIRLMNVEYVNIKDLHFTQYNNTAVLIEAGSHVLVNSNELTQTWNTGVEIVAGSEHTISNNYLHDMVSRSIVGYNIENITVDDNTIRNTSLVNGYGYSSGFQNNTGIFLLNAVESNISHNKLDSIGGMGIAYYGDNGIIQYNHLTDILLRIDDGGGLYSFGNYSFDCNWDHNYVENVVGSQFGKAGVEVHSKGSIAIGIYMDNQTNKNVISNNTFTNCFIGMMTNWDTHENDFISNITYKNTIAELMVNDFDEGVSGLEVKGNTFYSANNLTTPLVINNSVSAESLPSIGNFEGNYYLSPYSLDSIVVQGMPLSVWKKNADEPDAQLSFFTLEASDEDPSELHFNDTDEAVEITLEGDYLDIEGNTISSFQLLPFESRIVFKNTGLTPRIIEEVPLSIEDELNVDISIYPNPSNEWLYIENAKKGMEIQVISVKGNVVIDKILREPSLQIYQLPSGLYLIRLVNNKVIYNTKFVKY